MTQKLRDAGIERNQYDQLPTHLQSFQDRLDAFTCPITHDIIESDEDAVCLAGRYYSKTELKRHLDRCERDHTECTCPHNPNI